jgi:sortase (surface protein transpeptidase)
MSAALKRSLSWLAVLAGIALAVALSVWLIGEQARLGAGGPGSSGEYGPFPAALAEGEDPRRSDDFTRARLEIPTIGVNARVVELGLNPDGSLEVPKDYDDVGVWSGGPDPGQPGPAVVAGHVDSLTAPAVFFRLRQLKRGDRVRWKGDNGSFTSFVVTGREEHPKAEFPTDKVYGTTKKRELRLITCSGPADPSGRRSLNNLIVFARRAGKT